jgi:hypothetical protein
MHGHTLPVWGYALVLISGIMFGAAGFRLFGPKVTVILAVIIGAGIFFILLNKGA